MFLISCNNDSGCKQIAMGVRPGQCPLLLGGNDLHYPPQTYSAMKKHIHIAVINKKHDILNSPEFHSYQNLWINVTGSKRKNPSLEKSEGH